MKKSIFFCLALIFSFISSSAFSAIPQGKFPIEICADRAHPNEIEVGTVQYLQKFFQNSPKFRVTDKDEDRIKLGIIIDKYVPVVASKNFVASATPIFTYSVVWLAKPKDKHAYILWHDAGKFFNNEQFSSYILREANTNVLRIKNLCPYVFD